MSISELQRHEAIHAITDEGKFSAVYQLPHQLLSLEQYVRVIDESR